MRMDRNSYGRRAAVRAPTHGSVVLRSLRATLCGRVDDISRRGVRVRTESPVAADTVAVGTAVELDIRLDGAAGTWIRVHGYVNRIDPPTGSIALALDEVPEDFDSVVQEEIVATLACERVPHVMLVDGDPAYRARLAGALHAAGWAVTEAASPLEAIARLDESRLRPRLIAVVDTVPSRDADQLRDFLGHAYPALPVVAIGPGRALERGDDVAAAAEQLARLIAPA